MWWLNVVINSCERKYPGMAWAVCDCVHTRRQLYRAFRELSGLHLTRNLCYVNTLCDALMRYCCQRFEPVIWERFTYSVNIASYLKTEPINIRMFAVLFEAVDPEDALLSLFSCEWRCLSRRDVFHTAVRFERREWACLVETRQTFRRQDC